MALDWIDCGAEGKVRFSGAARGGDELGHNTFEVNLPSRSSGLFGEYEHRFAENDFDIEVVRFGYLHSGNVDNLHPNARKKLSPEEAIVVQHLANALMNDVEATKDMPIFASENAHFLGQVHFAPGWIELNE
jgi:hypothetical protein